MRIGIAFTVEPSVAVIRMIKLDRNDTLDRLASTQPRPLRVRTPGTGVTEQSRRQQVKLRGFGAAINCLDPDQDIVRRCLRIFHENIEITIVVENTCIDQLEFEITFSPPSIFLYQSCVWKLALRILV